LKKALKKTQGEENRNAKEREWEKSRAFQKTGRRGEGQRKKGLKET